MLLRNTKSTGKLATHFESEPYTVVTKERNEVMIQSEEGSTFRRDSSFVKPYNAPESGEPSGASEPSELENQPDATATARPSRITRLPDKFKDFVMTK